MNINHYFKKSIQSDFFKKTKTLLTGSIISQGLLFLSIPLLTRLFDESIFGIYVLYSSLTLLLKSVSSLNYEISILLPKRDKDAINLLFFNFLIILLFTVTTLLMIILFKNQILLFLNITKIGLYIYVLPLSVLIIGTITALEYWNNRMNNFKNNSIGIVTKSSTICISQILIGLSNFNKIGLIPGLLTGQFLSFLILIKLSFTSIKQNFKHVSFKRMFLLSKKYKDIPLFNTLLHFTDVFSNELPMLLITRFYGLSFSGFYGLSQKVIRTPSGVISSSVNQVFFNKASSLFNQKKTITPLVTKTYKHVIITAIAIFIPLFVSSYFFQLFFGNDWSDVGLYVRILIPWLFISFINSPVSSLVSILNKQKEFLRYEFILLVIRFFAIYLGYLIYNDILVSLVLLSLTGIIYNIFCFLFFIQISKNTVPK